jgi:hypothetical protein
LKIIGHGNPDNNLESSCITEQLHLHFTMLHPGRFTNTAVESDLTEQNHCFLQYHVRQSRWPLLPSRQALFTPRRSQNQGDFCHRSDAIKTKSYALTWPKSSVAWLGILEYPTTGQRPHKQIMRLLTLHSKVVTTLLRTGVTIRRGLDWMFMHLHTQLVITCIAVLLLMSAF